MQKSKWPKGTQLVKTAFALPADLWLEAKILSARQHRTLQEVVADALAAYLKPARGRQKKGGSR
jgi:hypothetical protein